MSKRGAKPSKMIGERFGKLLILGMAPREIWRNSNSHWICECDCGQQRIINGSDLKSGNVNSCGCIKKEKLRKRFMTHGYSNHPLYGRWSHMIARCTNPLMPDFNDYGGRGIRVCERWLKSFEDFVTDMGECPDGYSIDRIDNDGDYSPENCRWADSHTQALNKNRKLIMNMQLEF